MTATHDYFAINTTTTTVQYTTSVDAFNKTVWHATTGTLSVTADTLDGARNAITSVLNQYRGTAQTSTSFIHFDYERAHPRAIETFDVA